MARTPGLSPVNQHCLGLSDTLEIRKMPLVLFHPHLHHKAPCQHKYHSRTSRQYYGDEYVEFDSLLPERDEKLSTHLNALSQFSCELQSNK